MKKLLALMLVSLSAAGQTFVVSPSGKVLAGDPFSVRLQGLPANSEIRVSAERPVSGYGPAAGKRSIYYAEARFQSDAHGNLDLAGAQPLSGSYRSADLRGLLWSMVPTKNEAPADWKSEEVRYTAQAADGKALATTSLTFLPSLAEVKTEKIDKFPGAVFASLPGKERRPALILLGGSEGGNLITRSAAPWASLGFAVLALPYYAPPGWQSLVSQFPGLPAAFADIPVERLNEARAWLRARDDVDGERIGLHGTSQGAEFALIAASRLPWIKSVVAVVPSDVVWEGWGQGIEPGKRSSFSFEGKPLPFVPYQDFAEELQGFQTGAPVHLRRPQDKGRAAHPAAAVAARIHVEDYKGPLMVVGGQDDQVWASGMMAHNIAERRAEAGLETVSLIFSDAGHFISAQGLSPTTQYELSPSRGGGTPEGNARAQAEAWAASVAFLKRTLGSK